MEPVDTRYLKVTDVAERLSLDVSTVYKMLRSEVLPSIRIGVKAVRVPAGAFDAYLRRVEAGSPRPLVLRDSAAPGVHEELEDRIRAFTDQTGKDPRIFVEAWKEGSIEDTPENAGLALEALALRVALDRAPERELA